MTADEGSEADDDGAGAPESYQTVADRGRDVFEVAGSEFIGHAAPAHSLEEAETFVREVREAHPDATHAVPAYRVRTDDGIVLEHESDEDEPTGSAGKPALNVLKRRDLENVAAVVVRYFGGTELGVGGLARSYGRATKLAIDAAGVADLVPHADLSVVTGYGDSGTVRGILESEGLSFEADYGERARFDVRAPAGEAEGVADRLRSATSGRADVEVG